MDSSPHKTHRRPPPPHGDRRRYAYWCCRCTRCREANRVYSKRWREKRAEPLFMPPTGTVRRLQALVAYGWTYRQLAARLGTVDSWVSQLVRVDTRSKGILRRTADGVRVLFDELTALPPPTGRGAAYARTVAARYGWVSPWAWDDIDDPTEEPKGVDREDRSHHPCVFDEVAVERAIGGDAVVLTAAERREAVRRLWAVGLEDKPISDLLRMSIGAVRRTRQRHGWTRSNARMAA